MPSTRSRLRVWILVASLLALPACGSDDAPLTAPPDPPPPPAPPHRLLFIGNSLTAAFDLPAVVAGLARASGIDSVEAFSVVYGGYALEDHLLYKTANSEIASGQWDMIVLQQGPSTQPESRVALRRDVKIFADMAAAVGTQVGIYGVWPSRAAGIGGLDQSIESYRLAAEDVGGVLFPVGAAFRAALLVDPQAELYSGDLFHPSANGIYLAAVVICARLYDLPPVGMPSRFRYGTPLGGAWTIPPADALFLQQAAAAVLE
jgi:hypothetical protein